MRKTSKPAKNSEAGLGKTQQNRKVTSRVREKDVLAACLKFLKDSDYWCWRNNSGVMFIPRVKGGIAQKTNKMIRLGPAGMPDITIIMDDGSIVWVECKPPGKAELRPDQERWRIRATNRGHRFIVATCVDDLLTNGL